MENGQKSIIKIISVVNIFYIFISQLLVIGLVSLIASELPYLYISVGGITIDILQLLYIWGVINIVSSVALLISIYIPFKNHKFERYFWLIFGILLLIQPFFLTIIGIVLIFYSREIKSSEKETKIQEEKI